MNRNILMLGLALTVAACAAAVSLGWNPLRPARAQAAPTTSTGAAVAAGKPDPSLHNLLATPKARDYQQRKQFQSDAHDFFRKAASLGPAERERRAQALREDIERYENASELSAGESMLLRVGLIQATVADEAQQAAMVQQLATRYRADAKRREQQWIEQQQHDTRFQTYKQRERVVVAEVLAMQQIPGGVTRDEYLRQRLQAERERVYR
ncbi:hypothetical protein [Lysobacter sp. Root690]|uniref:hypothetical protein n=1 Tax=Lysobacter sp. Root690 TaxID=1736588 RepID=UPI000AF832FD|nr:hypothetical protein [Lysobacter sp. Root690]